MLKCLIFRNIEHSGLEIIDADTFRGNIHLREV